MSVQVIAIDKANAEARKELQKIREKIQAAKAEDKKVQIDAMHAYTFCVAGLRQSRQLMWLRCMQLSAQNELFFLNVQ